MRKGSSDEFRRFTADLGVTDAENEPMRALCPFHVPSTNGSPTRRFFARTLQLVLVLALSAAFQVATLSALEIDGHLRAGVEDVSLDGLIISPVRR